MREKIEGGWLSWAYDHSDSKHQKYSTLAHPLVIAIKGTLVFVLLSLFIRSTLCDDYSYPLHPAAPFIGIFLLIYLAFMIISRFI